HRSPVQASTRPRRASPARLPTVLRGSAISWLGGLCLAAAAGAGHEDFFQRGVARLDDLTATGDDGVTESFERPAVNDAPRPASAFHDQRGLEDGRLLEVFDESHVAALITAAHVLE